MPLWESNEIYFVAGLSVLVTLGVFASLAYALYRRAAQNGRRASEEQAALEKVLLRKGEAITTSPPTKPLIVSPSFSSPNKVPARHLRSGSYSPTHYLSPYHSRQPRRNSSPTSNLSFQPQPRLPQLQLQHHHPQPQNENQMNARCQNSVGGAGIGNGVAAESSGNSLNNNINGDEQNIVVNGNYHRHQQQQQHLHHYQNNSQYYGAISPHLPRKSSRSGGVKNCVIAPSPAPDQNPAPAFLPLKKCGGTLIHQQIQHHFNLKLHNPSFIKSEYAQLPGKDGADVADIDSINLDMNNVNEEGWQNKDMAKEKAENASTLQVNKWKKNCSPSSSPSPMVVDTEDGISLRRKLLLQKQYQIQQQHLNNHRLSSEPPGELFKTEHTVSEEIPYYISAQ